MAAPQETNKDKPVFILTTGRSGSTLFQKLLNTNPGLVIWGEHAGILNPLMHAYLTVQNVDWIPDDVAKGTWMLDPSRPIDPDRWTAWDGSFSKAGFNRSLRKFTDSLFCEHVPGQMRWGFKEIRYCDDRFIDFMLSLYPKAQFIVLMRNPVKSCVSFATSNSKEKPEPADVLESRAQTVAKKQVKPAFAFFRRVLAQDRDEVCAIRFENLVDDPLQTMRDIESFLELDTPFENENISKIVSTDIVSQRKRTPSDVYDLVSSHAVNLLMEETSWYESIGNTEA